MEDGQPHPAYKEAGSQGGGNWGSVYRLPHGVHTRGSKGGAGLWRVSWAYGDPQELDAVEDSPHKSHSLRSNPTARPTCPLEPPQENRPLPTPSPGPNPGAGTHIVLESLGFARVLTRLSAVRRCTVQVPEHAVGGRGGDGFPTRPHPGPLQGPPAPPRTHHHQECRKPGGSPSVMFFSQRICRGEERR